MRYCSTHSSAAVAARGAPGMIVFSSLTLSVSLPWLNRNMGESWAWPMREGVKVTEYPGVAFHSSNCNPIPQSVPSWFSWERTWWLQAHRSYGMLLAPLRPVNRARTAMLRSGPSFRPHCSVQNSQSCPVSQTGCCRAPWINCAALTLALFGLTYQTKSTHTDAPTLQPSNHSNWWKVTHKSWSPEKRNDWANDAEESNGHSWPLTSSG